jgi:protein tyrosine/serine phosphatase
MRTWKKAETVSEPNNFHWLDGQVARSARPQPADYPFVLANFNSMLDLEGESADIAEQDKLTSLRVFAGDISDWEIYWPWSWGGLKLSKMMNILAMAKTALKPMLAHCLHGIDRTGLFIAFWKVLECGWTPEAAMAEAKSLGYRWYVNFGLNRVWKEFVKQFKEGK